MTALRIATVVLLSVLVPRTAAADAASEAQLQYDLGVELYRQHRYPEALERFVASNHLVPNPNVAFNVAQTMGLLHRTPDAYNWYETVLHLAADDALRARATEARDHLAGQLAVVDVTTDPAGAEIFVDRVDLGSVGVAPRRVALTAGPHRLIAQAPGRRDAAAEVTASIGRVTPVPITLLEIVGTLRVTTPQPGARVVRSDTGEDLGTTPLSRAVPVGALTFVVSARGFVEQSRTVDVRDGETSTVDVELVHAATDVAVLSVDGTPVGASVRLGDRELGHVPLSLTDLTPGAAEVEIRAPDTEPIHLRIPLEAGGATRVAVTLRRHADRDWDGWRWVGYGVGGAALAGFAATGAVALSQRDAFFQAPSRSDYDTVGALNTVADVLLVVGIVIVATTFVLDLLLPQPPRSQAHVSQDR